MDDADASEERRATEDRFKQMARDVAEARRASKPAQQECADCGEELPELRKTYHCARCVDCQWSFEKRIKLFRRNQNEH